MIGKTVHVFKKKKKKKKWLNGFYLNLHMSKAKDVIYCNGFFFGFFFIMVDSICTNEITRYVIYYKRHNKLFEKHYIYV